MGTGTVPRLLANLLGPALFDSEASGRRRHGNRARGPLFTRLVPLLVVAIGAFAVGAILGAKPRGVEKRTATRFVAAWARNDLARMYELLDSSTRNRYSYVRFAGVYRRDAQTAALVRVIIGRVGRPAGGVVAVPVTLVSSAFGRLPAQLRLRVHGSSVRWRALDAFPALRAGEKLHRTTRAPARASLLARDGRPLAEGADRTSPLPVLAAQVRGSLGPAPPEQKDALRAAGFPADTPVGISGLERVFQQRLAGTPGGDLRAGKRVLASTAPRRAHAVRTSIDFAIEQAAVTALAGRLGGAVALDPRTGEILALAGLAYSALQPPGSTFKIITATAALEAHAVKLTDSFPVATGAVLEGREIANADHESCGGTFVQSFAQSCNSVFAPLGARVGGAKLVATAERFGFNRDMGIPGAAMPTIPTADQIGDSLAVGSSAIGQGAVQASALEMASVAATIAQRGRRPRPTLDFRPHPRFDRVTVGSVARKLNLLMLEVVRSGTGQSAQIPGVNVAGKTGTAELHDTTEPTGQPVDPDAPPPPEPDAWFVAYAPAAKPRISVAVLLVEAGKGGDVAAPAARGILIAGLHR